MCERERESLQKKECRGVKKQQNPLQLNPCTDFGPHRKDRDKERERENTRGEEPSQKSRGTIAETPLAPFCACLVLLTASDAVQRQFVPRAGLGDAHVSKGSLALRWGRALALDLGGNLGVASVHQLPPVPAHRHNLLLESEHRGLQNAMTSSRERTSAVAEGYRIERALLRGATQSISVLEQILGC